MKMNRYLVTALYVMAGCAVVVTPGGGFPPGIDGCCQLFADRVGTTVQVDGREMTAAARGREACLEHFFLPSCMEARVFLVVCYTGHRAPAVTAHPIRAPGDGRAGVRVSMACSEL
ncbi:MAG: hypothetical protein LBP56_03195 [Odoribacteraceae bacterium]|nr:hypothetical protein [Odoribacteraceae bacterium]